MRCNFLRSEGLLSGIALVLIASAVSSRGVAFERAQHVACAAMAFRGLVSPDAHARLKKASLIGDTHAWKRSAAHYDNCAWDEGRAWIRRHRAAAVMAAVRYAKLGSVAEKQAVFDHLGFVLHATQDFYAHSNWVETHAWGELADLEGQKPAGWISGTFDDDEPKRCPKGSPTHHELNKDAADRRGFGEARFDATLAVQEQLKLFAASLHGMAEEHAANTLMELGLRL